VEVDGKSEPLQVNGNRLNLRRTADCPAGSDLMVEKMLLVE